MKEKLIHILKQLSLRVLFTVLSFILVLYLFGLVTDEVIIDGEDEFDAAVFHFLADDLSPGLVRVMRFFTFFWQAPLSDPYLHSAGPLFCP